MYDANFNFMKSFTDPSITPDAATPGFAPFGIRNIGGQLLVTFAMQNAERHDDVAGPGVGFVDIFSADGDFVRRFATGGSLNSPWGLALGEFSAPPVAKRDRKSTRLNSSHTVISYAVFCLKKKTHDQYTCTKV